MNRLFASTILIIVLGASWLSAMTAEAVESRLDPQSASPSTALGTAIDGIWRDAAIASDPAYLALFKKVEFNPIAPDNMRRIIVDWPQPRSVRGWMQVLDVSFKDEYLTLKWTGDIGSGDKSSTAHQRFQDKLRTQGYRPLDKAVQEAFLKQAEVHHYDACEVWARTSGNTELLVSFEGVHYVGSDTYHSGLRFAWFARRPWRLPPPDLSHTLTAMPLWMKPKYLDETFFTALGNEPIVQLQSGNGFSFQLVNPVVDRLVKSLEQAGFEYDREYSPGRDGRTQKSWSRFTDSTYAHIVTSADGKQLRFSCQPPQHQGEPRKVKPPPRHPSLRLPIEKRPILKFDQLVFVNEAFQQQAKQFHDLAEQLAGKNWQVRSYRDERYSPTALYTAKWETNEALSLYFVKKNLPHQGIKITLEASRETPEQLSSLNVTGLIVPLQGWGSMVSYRSSAIANGGTKANFFVWIKLVTDNEIPISFDRSNVQVTSCEVRGSARDGNLNYDFTATSIPRDFTQSLQMLYDTPEPLRDAALANIAEFRKTASELIQKGESFTVYDYSNVRSDSPPRREPTGKYPPSDAIRKTVREQVENQLTTQESLIREHYQAIHASIQHALPLAELKPILLKQESATPVK